MTKKIYRTAQGKMVDLGALQLQNENVRAVGNMGVNARGDILDSRNKPINTRNQQVAKQYKKQTNVTDTVAPTSRRTSPPTPVAAEVRPAPTNTTIDKPAPASVPTGGLAAAIAKAREIKQEPLTPTGINTGAGPSKI